MRFTAALITVLTLAATAQTAPPTDPLAHLTPAQAATFQAATKAFDTDHFADALAALKPLLAQLPAGTPAQVLVAKYTAESALNTGDRPYALSLLAPIEKSDPYDWQAKSLLARYYAEGHQPADRELAALTTMHKQMPATQIGRLTQILLERDPLPNGGSMRVYYALEPWGRYKTYLMSRVYDKDNQQMLRISLESSDFDQPMFVQQHPEAAAKGDRRFSLDGYGPDQKLANGAVTQTHMTFGFFDAQPPYDTVHARMLKIAEGQASPISKMTPATN